MPNDVRLGWIRSFGSFLFHDPVASHVVILQQKASDPLPRFSLSASSVLARLSPRPQRDYASMFRSGHLLSIPQTRPRSRSINENAALDDDDQESLTTVKGQSISLGSNAVTFRDGTQVYTVAITEDDIVYNANDCIKDFVFFLGEPLIQRTSQKAEQEVSLSPTRPLF